MITLSKRLAASAAFVTKGSRVADVGCDHAYTSIYLVQSQTAQSCIAMDIKEGPLSKAKENIRRYGCGEQIETRLSDGLSGLLPGEADSILISGMGGILIQKILAASAETVAEAKELILQPQSEQEGVRRFLHGIGFEIAGETMLCEDGKYYVSMHAVNIGRKCEPYPRKIDYVFGKLLLEQRDPCLFSYLENRQKKYEEVVLVMDRHGRTEEDEDYRELKKKLSEIGEALDCFSAC